MAKLIRFSDASRDALERGVNALAEAVRVTIGPRSTAGVSASVRNPIDMSFNP